MYKQPGLASSYGMNDLGRTIYTYTMAVKPKIVFEVGTYFGYSAVCIAQALRDLGGDRMLVCYDLWDKYKYNHCGMSDTRKNITGYDLMRFVTLIEMPLRYIKYNTGVTPDMMHVDISNDGDIIKDVYNSSMCDNTIFEGGSKERDQVEWMVKHNKTPIRGSCSYTIIDERFPSISLMNSKKKG